MSFNKNLNVESLRTFKSLTAGSNVIMHNGKKLTFGGPLGGHGAFTTASPEEIRYLEEVVRASNGAVWEEVAPEAEAVLLANSEVVATQEQTQKDLTEKAAAAVDPKILAMQAKLGMVSAPTAALQAANSAA